MHQYTGKSRGSGALNLCEESFGALNPRGIDRIESPAQRKSRVTKVTRTQSFVRASLFCTVAFAAAAMLSACARNDDVVASVAKNEPVLVAQATQDADMPEVVIRASRDTARGERL
jgi:hypothetical protein